MTRLACRTSLLVALLGLSAATARAQSFRVQCPDSTPLHPNGSTVDPQHPGLVKCQHIGGGDGYATMGDGHQIYLFAFSPLSGLGSIEAGQPGTKPANVFNQPFVGPNYSSLASGGGPPPTTRGSPSPPGSWTWASSPGTRRRRSSPSTRTTSCSSP